MKAKHTDLEKLEQLYKESGNQPVVLCSTEGEAVKGGNHRGSERG